MLTTTTTSTQASQQTTQIQPQRDMKGTWNSNTVFRVYSKEEKNLDTKREGDVRKEWRRLPATINTLISKQVGAGSRLFLFFRFSSLVFNYSPCISFNYSFYYYYLICFFILVGVILLPRGFIWESHTWEPSDFIWFFGFSNFNSSIGLILKSTLS